MKNFLIGLLAIVLLAEPFIVMRLLYGWKNALRPGDIMGMWVGGILLQLIIGAIILGIYSLGKCIRNGFEKKDKLGE